MTQEDKDSATVLSVLELTAHHADRTRPTEPGFYWTSCGLLLHQQTRWMVNFEGDCQVCYGPIRR